MIKPEPKFPVKLMFIVGTSFALEVFQYILSIGRSDITDLITNTCGGLLGIAIYSILVKLFRSRRRTNKFITIIASIVTVLVIGVLAVLLIAN